MIADVCDLDELNTKERREGMFGSIFWWVIKVGMAAALAGGGYLLNATGFDVALESQSPDTVYWLRVFDVLVPAATSLLAIYALSKFELTEEKAHEVREALEQRRKAEAAVAP
jgi:GPH family glycoside/pentoside/hexuronide:cation symporter